MYGPSWRPLSPLLSIAGQLWIAGGVGHGYLGQFAPSGFGNGKPSVWVEIGKRGSVKSVPMSGQHDPLAPGDVLVSTITGGVMAFRPSLPRVWRPTMPPGVPTANRLPAPESSGAVCVPNEEWKSPGPTYASADGGLNWRRVNLSRLLPATAEPHVSRCYLRDKRLTVVTGRDSESMNSVHTIDLTTPPTVRSHFIGHGYGPLLLGVLRSGQTVWSMYGHRPVVATDSANSTFAPIGGPLPPNSQVGIVGDNLFYLRPKQQLVVSADAGQTWRIIDLTAG